MEKVMEQKQKTILDALSLALERYPRISGLLIGVALHPLLSIFIAR